MYIVVHADAAEYHEQTGAIDAHGDVHVTLKTRHIRCSLAARLGSTLR